MQPINFMKTASAAHHRAVRAWFGISAILVVITFTIIAFMQTEQWYIARLIVQEKMAMQKQLQAFENRTQKESHLHANRENIKKTVLKISAHSQQPKNPAEVLKSIKAALKSDASIESFSCNQQKIELKIASENTASLMKIADALGAQQSCTGMCITSLEHKDKNKMLAVLQVQQEQKKKVT